LGQFKLNLYIGLQIGEKVPLPPPLEDFSAAIYGKKGGGDGGWQHHFYNAPFRCFKTDYITFLFQTRQTIQPQILFYSFG